MCQEAKKAEEEIIQEDENYSSWVASFSEKLWVEYQSKEGIKSFNHGDNTVFQLIFGKGLDPLEVRQADSRLEVIDCNNLIV